MPEDSLLKELYDREAWFEGGERGGYEDYDAQTAPSLPLVAALLDRFPESKGKLSVLDIGCGYGSHLSLAADRHWKCFGIEPSAHAREVASQRHGERMTIFERAEDLLPQRFDLVLMFEVIEHLKDPYSLFFTLFGRDAIGEDTLVVIATPNARASNAITDPSGWAYRHPPSHLVYYSAKSLEILLKRLMFKNVNVRGLVPLQPCQTVRYSDEPLSINDEIGEFLGVIAEARGSDFKEFMHERYVPGAFWKLTEYEHLPRYSLAATLATGSKVLDFGCGTGYGSAFLAEAAESVVGLDISEEAIKWARETHRNPGLTFDQRSDLGQGLEQCYFDLVTCFEMIEHVDFDTQMKTIRSISSLLKPEGRLIISTPDPLFTAAYGNNPYHLREMTETEFMELLQSGFKYVTMLKQWVRPNIFIGEQPVPGIEPILFSPLTKTGTNDSPVGFVAICSNQPFVPPPFLCQFDTSSDFNRQTLETEHRLNRLRFENYTLTNDKEWLEIQLQAYQKQANEFERMLTETRDWTNTLSDDKKWLEGQVQAAREREAELQRSRIFRFLVRIGVLKSKHCQAREDSSLDNA